MRPRAIIWAIFGAAAVLGVLGIAAALVPDYGPLNMLAIFDLDSENTIPAWFSSVLLLTAAALLILIGYLTPPGQPGRMHWIILGGIFALLSLDEGASLHERLNGLFGHLGVGGSGATRYPWVIAATILVPLVGAAFVPFLWRLPPIDRIRFIVAGLVYVGGALGVEFLEGIGETRAGAETTGVRLLQVVQETGEMLGAALFVRALLDKLVREQTEIRIPLRAASPSAGRGEHEDGVVPAESE